MCFRAVHAFFRALTRVPSDSIGFVAMARTKSSSDAEKPAKKSMVYYRLWVLKKG